MGLGGPWGLQPHLELHGVDELPALLALVPARLGVAAEGTGALHEAIGQVPPAALTPELLQRVLQQEPPRQQPLEDVLGNPGDKREAVSATGNPQCRWGSPGPLGLTWSAGFGPEGLTCSVWAHLLCLGSPGLLGRGGAAEVVEGDAEPAVDVGVQGVVAVAELLRAQPLLQRPRLRGRAVLVRAAHEQRVPVPQAAVPAGHRRGHLEHLGTWGRHLAHLGTWHLCQGIWHTWAWALGTLGVSTWTPAGAPVIARVGAVTCHTCGAHLSHLGVGTCHLQEAPVTSVGGTCHTWAWAPGTCKGTCHTCVWTFVTPAGVPVTLREVNRRCNTPVQ